MLLKTKILLFSIIIFAVQNAVAQKNIVNLKGLVKYNTLTLQDINIVNKKLNIGTSSNEFGAFEIPAAKGDSILFSSISFQNRTIVITDKHINEEAITVYLEPGFNELDEVEILQKMRLEFNNISVDQRAVLDNDDVSQKQAPSTYRTTLPNQFDNGLNLVGIYKALTKRFREQRLSANDKQNEINFIKSEMPTTVLKLYGVDFFTEWLHIAPDEVNRFLNYCQDNGLGNYYKSDEIVVKDFLVKQSIQFNQLKKQ